MKKKYLLGFSIALIVFLSLFIFRFIYGYMVVSLPTETQISNLNEVSQSRDSIYQKQNIASKRIKGEVVGSSSRPVDQKYEKIATIEAQSRDLDSDEKKYAS